METIAPREYRYVIQAWLPNTLYLPQEFGMDNLDAAVMTMFAVTKDGSFYRVTVLETATNLEVAHMVSQEWHQKEDLITRRVNKQT